MPVYMHQFKYKDEQIKRLLRNEEALDRETFLRAAARAFDGELLSFYWCFGEFDGMALSRFANERDAFGCAMSVFGQGRVHEVRTTALLTSADGIEALQKAQQLVRGRAPTQG
jgi:uncharacterized protein with GYD domain